MVSIQLRQTARSLKWMTLFLLGCCCVFSGRMALAQVDQGAIKEMGVVPVLGDYLDEGEVARHATDRIARDLMDLAVRVRSSERPNFKHHTTSR